MAKKKTTKKSNVKKAPTKPASITDTINTQVIAAALSTANQPVLLKVCRLCEAKDGPFLNIFDADKVTAKKIEVVMPFRIEENDDLPHKICFRCSAKVEELYEFIQKCIKTQANLQTAIGNKGTNQKIKHRELWEEKLNQSNISNDDICDALIKKAMEGIKDIPLTPLPNAEEKAPVLKKLSKKILAETKKEEKEMNSDKTMNVSDSTEEPVILLKNEKVEEEPVKRCTRLSIEKKMESSENKSIKNVDNKEIPKQNKNIKPDMKEIIEPVAKEKGLKINQSLQKNNFSLEETPSTETVTSEPEAKPFNIMEHVSMIKVNGVGVLFQCKICNRNFLKKEVVISHACAKQGSVKIQGPKSFVPPEPPKVQSSTVKYITMKVNKEISKPVVSENKCNALENKKPVVISESINLDDDEDDKPLVPKKPKPKIGPASKIKRNEVNTTPVASDPPGSSAGSSNLNSMTVIPGTVTLSVTPTSSSTIQVPSVHFPTLPSLNSRYKLMPGPNNTYSLVEEKITEAAKTNTNANSEPNTPNKMEPKKAGSKVIIGPKCRVIAPKPQDKPAPIINNTLNEPQVSTDRPYPVGLIKSISAPNPMTPATTEPVAFPTPAMKKQSYTIVQTGNPSKLLLSTKPQTPAPAEEVPKKRQRKVKHVPKEDATNKQPFSVTIEDAAPAPDPGFFTFINVDPLLQPSYVLPTHNIIQESQISTSTNVSKPIDNKDDKYTCNMCNEKFSREKKLLAHIHSHYNKMDEEDQMRTERNPRKRVKK